MPAFDYAPNDKVNEQVGRSWKRYIQQPTLLKSIAQLNVPALFIYGSRDIRPHWPAEQVAHLMPHARFKCIEGAAHCIWFTHADELKSLLREFVSAIAQHAGRSPWR